MILPTPPAIISQPLQSSQYPALESWQEAAWEKLIHPSINRCPPKGTSPMSRYERAVLITLDINTFSSESPQTLTFSRRQLNFIYSEIAEAKPELFAIGSDPNQLKRTLETHYKTRFGYTPTPEITNTPDHHWAKISLDNLYRNKILKGDPEE